MNKQTRLKRCKRCISTLMLLACSLLSWAQTTVTGTVFDETNLDGIGPSVKEKRHHKQGDSTTTWTEG